MIKGLVSILTPCYNSGQFVHRLLDTILQQDYPAIEMVAVDDGSTDDTREKIEAYIPKFEAKGYTLKCLHKENGGQASAINVGLPLLQGEYIAWPDSDDYYSSPSSISTFVQTFQKADDKVGIVRTKAIFIEDGTGKHLEGYQHSLPEGNNFSQLLHGTYPLTPNSYMVRAAALDKAIPTRHIYDGQRAQNIQMFTPIAYLYEVKNTENGLVTIVVRNNSDSHSPKNLAEQLKDFDGWIDIYHHTLDNMESIRPNERSRYKHIISSVFLNGELAMCFHRLDQCTAKEVAQKMKKAKVLMHWKKRMKYIMLLSCPQLLCKIQ